MIRIPLDGCRNMWDIGGYPIDAQTVTRPRMVYRSGRLSSLTEEDLEKFSTLSVRTVVDLRSADEIDEHPDRIPENLGCRVLQMPITNEGLGKQQVVDIFARASRGEIDTHEHMIEAYRRFPMEMGDGLKNLLELMLDEAAYPLLMHCTAGKDRTGFAAAVLLSILGCSTETVIQDYLSYRRPELDKDAKRYASSFLAYGVTVEEESTYPYLLARREYIEALLDSFTIQWGSVAQYLSRRAGFSIPRQQELRNLLTEEVKEGVSFV